jgi:hypothetical protein
MDATSSIFKDNRKKVREFVLANKHLQLLICHPKNWPTLAYWLSFI